MSLLRSSCLMCCAVLFTATFQGCTKFQALNATVTHGGYSVARDIPFGDTPRLKLDVYRPRPGKGNGGIVVFFYGGSWTSGEKSDYRFAAQALVSRGFVAVLPNYRIYPEVQFPTFVEDGARAFRWVHDHAVEIGGNPKRIYLMGHSAGAHIVALLTLDPRYLKGVGLDRSAIRATAALSGPYDFVPGPDERPVFGLSVTNPKPYPEMEPINFVDGHEPPMLLIHGLIDKTVSSKNSDELAEKIRAKGGEVQEIVYPKRAHVGVVLSLAAPFRWLAPTLDDVTKFFNRYEGVLYAGPN